MIIFSKIMRNSEQEYNFKFEILENVFLTLLIYTGYFISTLIMLPSFFRCKLKVEITGDVIKIKRVFKKSCFIHQSNVVCSREYVKLPRYFSLRYFVITDKSNPKIKIKVSQYYLQNYTEIRNFLRVVPLRSDL